MDYQISVVITDFHTAVGHLDYQISVVITDFHTAVGHLDYQISVVITDFHTVVGHLDYQIYHVEICPLVYMCSDSVLCSFSGVGEKRFSREKSYQAEHQQEGRHARVALSGPDTCQSKSSNRTPTRG